MMYGQSSNDEMDQDLELALKLSLECSQNVARNYEPIPESSGISSTLETRKRSVELNDQNPSPKKIAISNEDEDYLLALKLSEEINQVATPANNIDVDFALALQLENENKPSTPVVIDDDDGDKNVDYLLAIQLLNDDGQPDVIPIDSVVPAASVTPTRSNNSPTSNPAGQSSKRNYGDQSISVVDPSWETIDPVPDIHALFAAFNKRFFWGKLKSVQVKWCPRMTQNAGLCGYFPENSGIYSIRLIQPLLEKCPRKDLVETMLHEMIHAYLFVTKNDCDRAGHGPQFCEHMDRINKESGANITIYQPYEMIRELLKSKKVTTDDGISIREMIVDCGTIHAILSRLAVQSHLETGQSTDSSNQNTKTTKPVAVPLEKPRGRRKYVTKSNSKSYWAKGTGYGTGDRKATWNIKEALTKKRTEEQHVIVLLQILAYYINSDSKIHNSPSEILSSIGNPESAIDSPLLPIQFVELIEQSCLSRVLASYLRNDSVFDMAKHVQLYRAIMSLLRTMTLDLQAVKFLLPPEYCAQPSSSTSTGNDPISLLNLLKQMKTCVDTYSSNLIKTNPLFQDFQASSSSSTTVNPISNSHSHPGSLSSVSSDESDSYGTGYGGSSASDSSTSGYQDTFDDEELNNLILDIQNTTTIVKIIVSNFIANSRSEAMKTPQKALTTAVSNEEIYIRVMKKLQFAFYDMISGDKFNIAYHYERNSGEDRNKIYPARMKTVAIEVSNLQNSNPLPCEYSSSIYVRTDTSRLDVMKALIIGPAETPYANGCFEFDIYFPPEYPNKPLLINLETTGRKSVRFNPNLYNCGKVCLSVLNTWPGSPAEQWIPGTSNLHIVLISIQSLILVPDPYFNEPGYEVSRGTAAGNQSSRSYNDNIRAATVQWAMLDQILNPSPCFKEIIQTHFFLKRKVITEELQKFVNENPGKLQKNFEALKQEFAKLEPPQGLEPEEAKRFSY